MRLLRAHNGNIKSPVQFELFQVPVFSISRNYRNFNVETSPFRVNKPAEASRFLGMQLSQE